MPCGAAPSRRCVYQFHHLSVARADAACARRERGVEVAETAGARNCIRPPEAARGALRSAAAGRAWNGPSGPPVESVTLEGAPRAERSSVDRHPASIRTAAPPCPAGGRGARGLHRSGLPSGAAPRPVCAEAFSRLRPHARALGRHPLWAGERSGRLEIVSPRTQARPRQRRALLVDQHHPLSGRPLRASAALPRARAGGATQGGRPAVRVDRRGPGAGARPAGPPPGGPRGGSVDCRRNDPVPGNPPATRGARGAQPAAPRIGRAGG